MKVLDKKEHRRVYLKKGPNIGVHKFYWLKIIVLPAGNPKHLWNNKQRYLLDLKAYSVLKYDLETKGGKRSFYFLQFINSSM